MNELKAEVVEAVAILELEELKGREKLPNTPLHALAVVSEYGAVLRCVRRNFHECTLWSVHDRFAWQLVEPAVIFCDLCIARRSGRP